MTDYTVLYTTVYYGNVDEFRCCVYSTSGAGECTAGCRIILLCHRSTSRCNTATKHDLLGNVVSCYEYPHFSLELIIVIGVIGADVTYLVASLFAATHVSESQQSIASGIVATTAAVWGSIYNAIAAALISGSYNLLT